MPRQSPPRVAPACVVSALALAAMLAAAASARADFPNPANSTIPAYVTLVGHEGGVADPGGEFIVVFRDLANNPIAGATIVCDFTGCPDLRIAAAQPFPGVTADCATRTVRAITDAAGTARFRIVGGAVNPGNASGAGFRAMKLYADGILLGSVTASAVDQNGLDGLTANDMSAWLADLVSGASVGRSDYDGNETLGANDLSKWLGFYGAGHSRSGAASLPGGVCP